MTRPKKQSAIGKLHEHTFNVALGQALAKQHGVWPQGTAEILSERKQLTRGQKRPDIMILEERHRPVAVEVELTNGKSAEKDARARLGMRLRHNNLPVQLAIAVVAPEGVQELSESALQAEIQATQKLRYAAFFGEAPTKAKRWPKSGWMEGTISDLAQTAKALGIPFETLNKLAADAAWTIGGMAERIATMSNHPGGQRNVKILQTQLELGDAERAVRATAVIWLNAMLLQIRLARHSKGAIPDPDTARFKRVNQNISNYKLCRQWIEILEINYRSIFAPALEALDLAWDSHQLDGWLSRIHEHATEIEAAQVGSMVDIGGELFPQIVLEDRSAAAAYYTNAPIGEMLGWLTLPEDNDVLPDWSNTERVKELRVGDLACGTGTLLRALYRRIRLLHGSAGGNNAEIHQALMERGLVGVDISAIAAHLTATGLAGMEPSLTYNDSQVGMARVGAGGRIGSLEALTAQSLSDLLGETVKTSRGRATSASAHTISVPHGEFDILMMNPPYTRPHGGEYVFDVHGMTEADRTKCMKRWAKLTRNTPAQSRAGLGASFTVLADKKLRIGGRVGIVLPMSVSADPSWRGIREMFAKQYEDLIVVNLTNLKQGSLSADTAMSEVLVIGTKVRSVKQAYEAEQTRKRKAADSTDALFINLARGPAHFAESYAIAQAVTQIARSNQVRQGSVMLGDETVGYWAQRSVRHDGTAWGNVGAEDVLVADAATELLEGRILLPHDETVTTSIKLPMTTLGQVFKVGPTHDVIGHPKGGDPRGAFEFVKSNLTNPTKNPAVWATQSDIQTAMRITPTHQGTVQDKVKAHRILQTRSDLLAARNCRWTAQRIAAGSTAEPAMGGRAFTTLEGADPGVKAAFQLWANSTLGLLIRWRHGSRQQPGRSGMQITSLKGMPVPDFRKLSKAKRNLAIRHVNELESEELLPCALAHCDPTRKKIDEAVCDILSLPKTVRAGLAGLTKLWCREPTVHGHSPTLLERLPK